MVDEASWWWRGRRWAHLVSDTSLEELHACAGRLGVRRVSFGGDHYDVTEQQRELALQAGAQAVSSRELVGALRRAGLRQPAGIGSHRWTSLVETSWAPATRPPLAWVDLVGWAPPPPAQQFLTSMALEWGAGQSFGLRILGRRGELALLLAEPKRPSPRPVERDGLLKSSGALSAGPSLPPPITGWWLWDRTPEPSIEIFLDRPYPQVP